MADIAEVKKLLNSGSLIFGATETMKLLRKGSVQKVFLATTCAVQAKEDIIRLAKGKVEVVELSASSVELGTACKKPFGIAVIGLKAQ